MLVVPQPMDAYRPSRAQFWAFVLAYRDLREAREKVVPLRRLHGSGIDNNMLLWMLYHGHVEHLRPRKMENGDALRYHCKHSDLRRKSTAFS